jgi:hypothetical protein
MCLRLSAPSVHCVYLLRAASSALHSGVDAAWNIASGCTLHVTVVGGHATWS